MSDTDSFIDEVTEEVRRDHLFQLMRKYGWIAVAIVLLIVGSAAYIEWQKSRDAKAAQAAGDAILAAVESNQADQRVADLQKIVVVSPEGQAVVSLITANEAINAGDTETALKALNALATDASLPLEMQQLASLRALMAQHESLSIDERKAGYQALSSPGAPYRLLAEEQLALIAIEEGQISNALERLEVIRADAETSQGLRGRATELIVALGGVPASVNEVPGASGN